MCSRRKQVEQTIFKPGPKVVEGCHSILNVCLENIYRSTYKAEETGLFDGIAGELLFLWNYRKFDKYAVSESLIEEKLSRFQDNFDPIKSNLSIYNGILGSSWLLEYLNQESEVYSEALMNEVDDFLLELLSQDKWQSELELMFGISGISIYLSRRQKMFSGTSCHFDKFLSHLESLLVRVNDDAITWSQPPNSRFRKNKEDLGSLEFNLGHAHGVTGIISSLIPILQIPELEKRASILIEEGCNWLLTNELKDNGSLFPNVSGSLDASRLGWCYGDLPIALILARAGNKLGNSNFRLKAKEIALNASSRSPEEGRVFDTGLCHGSAGISLIFYLLYKELEQPFCLKMSYYWLEHVVDSYESHGVKGLYNYAGENLGLVEEFGLMIGYAGIGLCILALIGEETSWIDCLSFG